MVLGILGYQVIIFLIIVIGAAIGGKKGLAITMIIAVLWTLVFIFAPWLMILQFFTIIFAFSVAKPLTDKRNEK